MTGVTHFGDCREVMRQMIARGEKVQMCVTSPPYHGLRDYGVEGQIGLERSLPEFLDNLVEVFSLVYELLEDDGTCWINMGDSYASDGGPGWQGKSGQRADRTFTAQRNKAMREATRRPLAGLKPKDLIGQPWRLAFALQDAGVVDMHAVRVLQQAMHALIDAYDGEPIPDKVLSTLEGLHAEWAEAKGKSWYLRQAIIWHKPNPMPESCKDRCTNAHEYVFLLARSERYYYDQEAIKEPASKNTHPRRAQKSPDGWDSSTQEGRHGAFHKAGREKGATRKLGDPETAGKMNPSFEEAMSDVVESRNKRSVWTIPSEPYSGAHFATFPTALIKPCVLAGSRPGDTVLDPFFGSGTTGQVCNDLGRNWVGIELNRNYEQLQIERTRQGGLPL
ncbi:MAG: site-specific DNA-methyltransferase [Pseudomonadota bacterium]